MRAPTIFLMILLCGMRPDSGPDKRGTIHLPKQEHSMQQKIRIQVGDHVFPVTLQEGPAIKPFLKMLPFSMNMRELNGNEKYGDLPKNLPAQAVSPGRIEAGDVMLFGTNTLVLFYRSFNTSYGYTRIGKVDDPRRLEAALGEGDVEVNWME